MPWDARLWELRSWRNPRWNPLCKEAGATLIGGQGVIANEAPDGEAVEACEKAGEALAEAAK